MFFTKVWLFKIMNADANGCVFKVFLKMTTVIRFIRVCLCAILKKYVLLNNFDQ